MKKSLICDLDGTIINITSEIEMIRFLIKKYKMGLHRYGISLISFPLNTLPSLFNKGSWLKAWSAFRSLPEEQKLFRQFSSHIINYIIINEEVIEVIQNFTGRKILLTGCYEPLAISILEKLNLKKTFDVVIGTKLGCYNLFIKQHPIGHDKLPYLAQNSYSVGIGNSWGDRFFLLHCKMAYIVAGSKKLEKLAVQKNWHILPSFKQKQTNNSDINLK